MSNAILTDRPTDRNYGIDLLRIIATLMVCVLHLLGNGGVLNNTENFSVNYAIGWFIESLAFVAVNCYAIISGFVGATSKKQRYTNLAVLWLQVFTISVVFSLVFFIAMPESIGIKELIKSFFPVLFERYWYFTAYFLLFFTIPLLNCIIKNFTKKQMRNTLIVFFVLSSVIPTVCRKDTFSFGKGYAPFWLMALYLVGAYIRIYNPFERLKNHQLALIYLGFTVITWCPKMVIEMLTQKLLGQARSGGVFFRYDSPTVVLAAVALVILFSRIQLKRTKLVSLLAPVTFGIYIIDATISSYHCDKFAFIAKLHWAVMPLAVIGIACAFFIVFGTIEYVRIQLFKMLKIKNKVMNIETKISAKLGKYISDK